MMSIDIVVTKIISEQELVIGPLAWDLAKSVQGLTLSNHEVKIKGDQVKVLDDLVKAYEGLFGPASREVCRDAIASVRSELDVKRLPDVLK